MPLNHVCQNVNAVGCANMPPLRYGVKMPRERCVSLGRIVLLGRFSVIQKRAVTTEIRQCQSCTRIRHRPDKQQDDPRHNMAFGLAYELVFAHGPTFPMQKCTMFLQTSLQV